MRKYFFIATVFTLIFLGPGAVLSQSDSIQFGFISPNDKDTVFGEYEIVFDANFSQFQVDSNSNFKLELFQNSCNISQSNYYGQIDEIEYDSEKSSYKYAWNVATDLKDAASPSNGIYCLVIKSPSIDRNIYQDKREIVVNNTQSLPPAISENIEDKIYILGSGNFEYDIENIGESDESIRYSFLQSPEFISINDKTGLITNNRNIEDKTSELVRILVRNTNNVFRVESFYLNIIHPEDQSDYESISINKPQKSSIISDVIDLQIDDLDILDSDFDLLRLTFFDKNRQDRVFQIDIDDEELGQEINIEELENNLTYDLVIELVDQDEEIIWGGVISYLRKLEENPVTQYSSILVPSIDIVTPPSLQNVNDFDGIIFFRINYVDTSTNIITSVFLNEENISLDCEIVTRDVECFQSTSSLNTGFQKLGIELDVNGEKTYYNYNFNIQNFKNSTSEPQQQTEDFVLNFNGNEISLQALIVLVFGLIIGFFLLLIPWLLFMNWSKSLTRRSRNKKPKSKEQRSNQKENLAADFQEDSDKYDIGETQVDIDSQFNIGGETNYEDQFSNSQDNSVGFSPQPELPDSYTDEEIPDWLKDPSGSTPVGSQGAEIKIDKPADNTGSEPYGFDDYGKSK